MIHRLIYQKKAVYSQTDVDNFSTKEYTSVKLMRTKKGKPVAISESNDTKNWHWRVQYGFSTVVFPSYADVMRFCRDRFFELSDTAQNGGRA